MKKKKQRISLYLSFLVLVGLGYTSQYAWSPAPEVQAKIKSGDPLPANLFVELGKNVMPAIVNISTSTLQQERPGSPLYNDPMYDMLEQFFGQQFQGPGQQQQPRPAHSLGSGFVIRDDGLIITNNHVIAGADVITVQIGADADKTYEAKVIGLDEATDIALLKVDAGKKLKFLKLGNSSELEVGEWVAAFGNPFGHAHTMTKGIISAKGREIGELNRFPFLQTDASINPGNSGGPLVNTRGQVIGVNTAIDARAQGIGFAIPIDSVKPLIPQLEKNGRISRGFLGVMGGALSDIHPEALKRLNIDTEKGVLVTEVTQGSAAEKAGIQVYDVITKFDGKKIENMQDLVRAVGDTTPGDKAKVEIFRQGSKKSLSAKVGDRPDTQAIARNQGQTYKGQKAPFNLGFSVATVTPEMVKVWDLNPRLVGKAVIVDVERNSPASSTGLRSGDVILDVNRQAVSSGQQVQKALRKGTNALRVVRGNRPPTLVLLDAQ